MPTKSKDNIQENKNTAKKGLHRPMIMDGGKGKKFEKYCDIEDIEHQQKMRENDGIRDNEGVHSPMSNTMSKQGIEEIWGDISNVSKTIVR